MKGALRRGITGGNRRTGWVGGMRIVNKGESRSGYSVIPRLPDGRPPQYLVGRSYTRVT
jgi:hypothetical protein